MVLHWTPPGSQQWPHQTRKDSGRSNAWRETPIKRNNCGKCFCMKIQSWRKRIVPKITDYGSGQINTSYIIMIFCWNSGLEVDLILLLAASLRCWTDWFPIRWRSWRITGVSGYDTSPSTVEAKLSLVKNGPWRLKVTRPSGQMSARVPDSYLKQHRTAEPHRRSHQCLKNITDYKEFFLI